MINTKDFVGENSGSYGMYYRLGGILGIKMLYEFDDDRVADFDTVDELIGSQAWEAALMEGETMRIAWERTAGITPEFHRVIPVKDGDVFMAGVVMEHIPGMTLEKLLEKHHAGDGPLKMAYEDAFEVMLDAADFAKNLLEEVGIFHKDLENWKNIMVQVSASLKALKQVVPIDFDATRVLIGVCK